MECDPQPIVGYVPIFFGMENDNKAYTGWSFFSSPQIKQKIPITDNERIHIMLLAFIILNVLFVNLQQAMLFVVKWRIFFWFLYNLYQFLL